MTNYNRHFAKSVDGHIEYGSIPLTIVWTYQEA